MPITYGIIPLVFDNDKPANLGSMPFSVELDIKGSGGLGRCIWAGPAPADCLANA